MRFFLLLLLFFIHPVFSQNKTITLEDIWANNTFQTESLKAFYSMQMIKALVEANKEFDYFGYPDKAHGIYKGKNTRLHLFKKMTTFIDRSLGDSGENEQKIID